MEDESKMRSKLTLFERFYPKIEFTETCWLWTGATLGRGYGVLGRGGAGAGNILAHRASYELFIGPIPDGLTIDHLCRVKLCVRPEHLEAVSNRENNLRAPESIISRHLAATHCPSGHPYDAANTYVSKIGDRKCRECGRLLAISRRTGDPDAHRASVRAWWTANATAINARRRAKRAAAKAAR